MACELVSAPGAVFALWGLPTVDDVDRVLLAIETAAQASGRPVVYVARIPAKAPPPDAATRSRIDTVMPRLMQVCSTYHVLLEGEGFAAAVKRGVLIGLFQLTWRRGTFFVHAVTTTLTRGLSTADARAVGEVLQMANARGLLAATL